MGVLLACIDRILYIYMNLNYWHVQVYMWNVTLSRYLGNFFAGKSSFDVEMIPKMQPSTNFFLTHTSPNIVTK